MSLLDAARHLAEKLPPVRPPTAPGYRYIPCDECGEDLDRHDPMCPSVTMPKIVAVIEAAARVVAIPDIMCSSAIFPAWASGVFTCHGCGQDTIRHASDCPAQALVAALKDDVVPQESEKAPT